MRRRSRGSFVENLVAGGDCSRYRRCMFSDNPSDPKLGPPISDRRGIPEAGRAERRGSERLLMDVPLLVCGESSGSAPFQEETFSVSVSAHGALVMLAAKVQVGQIISLENLRTHEETKGRVARLSSLYGGLAQVGIEFVEPAPDFWRVESPPRGWHSART